MGRLTKDPVVRYSQSKNPTAVARFTLAVDRRFRRNEDAQSADFINCVSFGHQAEFAEKYFHKGTKIIISGRIQTGSYTNKENQKVSTFDVIIEEQDFAESKSSGNASSASNEQHGYIPSSNDGFMNIPEGLDEELPFN